MTAASADPLAPLLALEGVASAYAAARDGIDVLLRDRGLRRTSPELTTEALLLGAQASAELEGSATTLEQLRAGEGDELAAAAARVSVELLAMKPVLDRSPLQAFARLHTLAAAGYVTEDRLGRPTDSDAAARLRALADLLTAKTSAPALLVAAVVHAELATTAPFASHNGIVARAAERLVLVSRGVDELSVTVPEAGHLSLRPAYQRSLRSYREGEMVGVQAWLRYAAQAYAAGAEASPLARRS